MKWFFKIFFKTIRIIAGPFMLLWEIITTPKGIVRSAEEQARVDKETSNLILYEYRTCPFCIKVRREIKRYSLNIERRDPQRNEQSREELLRGGGQVKVPCLRIKDAGGNITWMYESAEINNYLHEHFA